MSTLPQAPQRAIRPVPAVMPTQESRREEPASVPVHLEGRPLVMSPTVGRLALALSKAQATMGNAHLDAKGAAPTKNGLREFKFASLAAVRSAILPHLTANGIAPVQTTEEGGPSGVCVVTWLIHESSEWMCGRLWVPARQPDAQAFGSAVSYARRHGLSSIVCLATSDEDDDAPAMPFRADGPSMPAARAPEPPAAPPPPAPRPPPSTNGMTLEEQAIVQRYDAEFDTVRSRGELTALRRTLRRVAPAKKSIAFRLWFFERGDGARDRVEGMGAAGR